MVSKYELIFPSILIALDVVTFCILNISKAVDFSVNLHIFYVLEYTEYNIKLK